LPPPRAQVNISLLVDNRDADRAVRALHAEFFEGAKAGR
jgi:aspartokinase